jgi:hypothetical protein
VAAADMAMQSQLYRRRRHAPEVWRLGRVTVSGRGLTAQGEGVHEADVPDLPHAQNS